MYKSGLAAAVVLVAALAVGSAGQDKQNPPKAPAVADADFTGKVLYVLLKEARQETILQKPRIQRLGGRAFLVGQYAPRTDDDEPRDEIYWHPIDDIVMLIEYKNLAAARKAIRAAAPGRR